jgi:hypothetical protein
LTCGFAGVFEEILWSGIQFFAGEVILGEVGDAGIVSEPGAFVCVIWFIVLYVAHSFVVSVPEVVQLPSPAAKATSDALCARRLPKLSPMSSIRIAPS